MKDLKLITNGDGNFQKMCAAVLWTNYAELYMEKDDETSGNDGGNANVENIADGGDENIGNVDEENRGDDGLRNVNVDNRTGEANENRGNVDEENRANDGEMRDEEAQVEANLVGFIDEEEHGNSETTPQNSDCEDDGRSQYVRCKKGSGDLRLGQVFDSIKEFNQAVVDYALKGRFNVKYNRWSHEQSEVFTC